MTFLQKLIMPQFFIDYWFVSSKEIKKVNLDNWFISTKEIKIKKLNFFYKLLVRIDKS